MRGSEVPVASVASPICLLFFEGLRGIVIVFALLLIFLPPPSPAVRGSEVTFKSVVSLICGEGGVLWGGRVDTLQETPGCWVGWVHT